MGKVIKVGDRFLDGYGDIVIITKIHLKPYQVRFPVEAYYIDKKTGNHCTCRYTLGGKSWADDRCKNVKADLKERI